jgi:hypothetical protein
MSQGVGNSFQGNHIHNLPHAAFLGGGNEAVCTAGWAGKPAWWPDDRGVCGANDNMFCDNIIEDVRTYLPSYTNLRRLMSLRTDLSINLYSSLLFVGGRMTDWQLMINVSHTSRCVPYLYPMHALLRHVRSMLVLRRNSQLFGLK